MSDEWYTPPQYVNAARRVMGGIDLDPASCAPANEVVRASRFYTRKENGLLQPWYGRIWLNPPYGRAKGGSTSFQAEFIRKLLYEWQEPAIERPAVNGVHVGVLGHHVEGVLLDASAHVLVIIGIAVQVFDEILETIPVPVLVSEPGQDDGVVERHGHGLAVILLHGRQVIHCPVGYLGDFLAVEQRLKDLEYCLPR